MDVNTLASKRSELLVNVDILRMRRVGPNPQQFLRIPIDPIHAAAMMNKERGLAGKFTANLRVST